MDHTHRTPGYTLLELAIVLTIAGAILSLAVPAAARGLDAYAVRASTDALAAGVARTRAVAIARGGARMVMDAAEHRFWIEGADGSPVGSAVDLGDSYGVRMDLGGSTERAELRFDALGIGRLMNRTVRIRRGDEEARLTLSAYGRVRRW